MDWHSRYVLSWELSNTLEVFFCVEALTRALRVEFPEIFNTDQGAQFTSEEFTQTLQTAAQPLSLYFQIPQRNDQQRRFYGPGSIAYLRYLRSKTVQPMEGSSCPRQAISKPSATNKAIFQKLWLAVLQKSP